MFSFNLIAMPCELSNHVSDYTQIAPFRARKWPSRLRGIDSLHPTSSALDASILALSELDLCPVQKSRIRPCKNWGKCSWRPAGNQLEVNLCAENCWQRQ